MAFTYICALRAKQLEKMHEGLDQFEATERLNKSWNVPESRLQWARLHWKKQSYNLKRKLGVDNKVGQLL